METLKRRFVETEQQQSTVEPKPSARLTPVRITERISSVDTLRGLAVLCILVMNIYAFAMPFAAYLNPLLYGGSEGIDLYTWFFTHLFFDQKFMTIFSMLFGAGLILMGRRSDRFAGIYYRRILWLLLIGMLHGYLLWMGDILFFYAVCGLLLYPLRRLSPKTLLIIGIILLLVGVPISVGMGYLFGFMKSTAAEVDAMAADGKKPSEMQLGLAEGWDQTRSFMAPDPEEIKKQVDRHRGGYWDITIKRVPEMIGSQIFGIFLFVIWRLGGLMLLGMALMKLGVFAAERSRRYYIACMAFGYGLGLPLAAYSVYTLHTHQFDMIYAGKCGNLFNYFASVLVALGHVGAVMLICKSDVLPAIRARLADVGRMALTNYLLQSVICTTLFYGYGFGLFGHLGRFAQMGLVPLVWILLVAFSSFWMRRFRFGPAEWLWRSLTYWRRQPMRLA
jgi:uncharacterized protein